MWLLIVATHTAFQGECAVRKRVSWLTIIGVLIGLIVLSYLAQLAGLIPDARPGVLVIGFLAVVLWLVVQICHLI
jgi:hypothetical protein